MGNRIEKRERSEVMSGIGGAGTFSDGKLHYTAKLSHERAFHLITPKKYQDLLDYIDGLFCDFGVNSEYYPKNKDDVNKLIEEAQLNDVQLIIRKAQHVGTDKLRDVMLVFQNYLESKGVDILDKTKMEDLYMVKGEARGVIVSKDKKILGKKILLTLGRISTSWLQKLGTKHGIKYIYDMVEMGVRVEFPAFVMRRHAEALYEVVFKVRTTTYDDIVRTFCTCPNGMVATERYDGYVCVNGHSNSDHNSENSNFAFVCEVHLTEPVENTIAYAKSIAEVASTIGGGKPILQRLADLQKGRRSTWRRLNKSFVKPTNMNVTPGDISMALPHRIVMNILEGLEKLNHVMPGIYSGSTLLYAPEVKFRSSKVDLKPTMETTLKNVYAAGDAAGISGSITGAAATGIMAARGMLR